MSIRAIILAGNGGTNLGVLAKKQNASMLMFGGSYRLIDFALSNCVNSGLRDILVIPQFQSDNLINHVGTGRPWGLEGSAGGITILEPIVADESELNSGSVENLYRNLNHILARMPDTILIVAGTLLIGTDFGHLADFHKEHHADLTVITYNLPSGARQQSESTEFSISDDYRIRPVKSNGSDASSLNLDISILLFKADVLDNLVRESSNHEGTELIDVVEQLIEDEREVYAYPFSGYWGHITNINAYWTAHMDLVAQPPALDLTDRSWPIHSNFNSLPPASFETNTHVADCIIENGVRVSSGTRIERSVISSGVYIGPGAIIRESVIWPNAYIEAGTVVERAVIGENCVIGHHAQIGSMDDMNHGTPGIVAIESNSLLPSGYTVPRGMSIEADLVLREV